MNKHTLGPWHVNAILNDQIVGDETSEKYTKLHVAGANTTVATVYRPADARLIATAPELLEALRGYLDADTSGHLAPEGREAALHNARSKARDAIAKAQGKGTL